MIELTPLEIRQKKGDFPRSVRGYSRDLVDDFLELVADRVEGLVRENMEVSRRVNELEEALDDYRERDAALTEALVAAQEAGEETRKQARKDAELVRREAELEAEGLRGKAVEAREEERQALRRLRARRAQFVRSYQSFLERELAELQVVVNALGLGRESDAADGEEEGADAGAPAEAEGDWLSSLAKDEK